MKPELRIVFMDMASSDALCAAIEVHASNLEGSVDAATGCNVLVEKPAGSGGRTALVSVRVHATAIDGQPIIGEGRDGDELRAVKSAFDIAQWQLAERATLAWTAAARAGSVRANASPA